MQIQLLVVIICCRAAAAAQNYTHADIVKAVDFTFGRLDVNRDSILELDELTHVYDSMDINKDGRVSEAEYGQGPRHMFWSIVFLQLDYNKDGYLDHMAEYGQYTVMDTSGDDEVSRSEYDAYYTKVVEDAIKNFGYLLVPLPTSAPTGVPT